MGKYFKEVGLLFATKHFKILSCLLADCMETVGVSGSRAGTSEGVLEWG